MTIRTRRSFWLIADDYGLSPGVSRAIRMLAERGRLSGTGCMALFDDWAKYAHALRPLERQIAIGLHLTLTDFPAASTGRAMPGLKRLLADLPRGAIADEAIAKELDAQLERFTAEIGSAPAFIDGHQHVHFLRPVRRWLRRRYRDTAPQARPWIRGAPALAGAPAGMRAKIAFTRTLAAGFDRSMREDGFTVRGPLTGFYDWRGKGRFAEAITALLPQIADGGVMMCHPGFVDDVLRGRDALTDARKEEEAFLAGAELPARLQAADIEIARAGR